MDTSEQYIKMCDCPEIQRQWKPQDFISYHAYHKRLKRVGDFIYGVQWENSGREELIWLPRQDQIQETLPPHDHASSIAVYFGLFCDNEAMYEGIYAKKGWGFIDKFSSMEQLWLAFYMYEKHKKTWDGKKWVE